jgi:phosphoribosyl 1,2-cyclic phosphodiesterase
MARAPFSVRFWGVRGSTPTPGATTIKVGGNTSCVELRLGEKHVVFDAGTGLRELGASLLKEKAPQVSLLLSHYHWDHLLGLPFFAPLFKPGTELRVYGERKTSCGGAREAIQRQFSNPHFPVDFTRLPSTLHFHDVQAGDNFSTLGVRVRVGRLNHPQGAVCYRASVGGKHLVYASDHEHDGEGDTALIGFARNADILVYDAMYTNESYACGKRGWGHSTWQEAARVAGAANVGRLYLFHHDPIHDDKTMAKIERSLQRVFPEGWVAREGMEVVLK